MSKQHNIESLFNSKLSGLEQSPSPEVWEKTARTLRRRAFLRFNPRRFNIYYLASVITIAAGTLMLKPQTKEQATDTPTSSDVAIEITMDSSQSTSTNNPTSISPDDDNSSQSNQSAIKSTNKKTSSPDIAYDANTIASTEYQSESKIPESRESKIQTKTVTSPIIYFSVSDYEGCAPLSVNCTNNSSHLANFKWTFNFVEGQNNAPEAVIDVNGNAKFTFEQAGTYNLSLQGSDDNGIIHSHSELIEVHTSPIAEFEIADGKIYNYSLNAVEYKWDALRNGVLDNISNEFNCELISYKEDAILRLVVKNEFACPDTATKLLPATELPAMEFPTAFSPNTNGATGGYYNLNSPDNTVFYPTYKELPATYRLKIYSKAGKLLFETIDINIGWDGYMNETISPQGVYIYECTGTWSTGDAFNYRGDITLLLDW